MLSLNFPRYLCVAIISVLQLVLLFGAKNGWREQTERQSA
ncbi:putative membrane protein [Escherichia coli 2865200]|nr:putative membrane protein [Escherichia coli 2865200]